MQSTGQGWALNVETMIPVMTIVLVEDVADGDDDDDDEEERQHYCSLKQCSFQHQQALA